VLGAARAASAAFIGAVGEDAAADGILMALGAAGVDATAVAQMPGPTGRAFVTLTPDRQNSIVVLPLANELLEPAATRAALDRLRPAVVLTQLEIPDAVVRAVAAWCAESGSRFILNPSPVRTVSPEVLAIADPVIVNEHEARELLDSDSEDWPALAARLAGKARSAVVTAGGDGAYVAVSGSLAQESRGAVHVPGRRVVVVDTTGAGDAFAGTLAARLAAGAELVPAVEAANREAARIIQLSRESR